MANNPFDRTVINTRERPISSDINQAQSQIERTIRHVVDNLLLPRSAAGDDRAGSPITGFIGDAFNVREDSPAGLSIVVAAGLGFFFDAASTPSAIGGVSGVDDLSRYKPLILLADQVINVPSPDPTNPRIDIVEATINRRLTNPSSRDVLNAVTGIFEPQTVNKTLAWDVGTSVDNTTIQPANSTAALSYKQGVPSATPAIPSTSPGYAKVAEILVSNGVSQIDQNNIKDMRLLLAPYGIRRVTARGTFLAGAVTLNSLSAPPGVLVSFSDTGGARKMYVKAGDVTGTNPTVLTTRATAAAAGGTASIVAVNTALQTALDTAADTDPVMKVVDDFPGLASSGQKLIEVDLIPVTDDKFSVQVEW